MGLIKWFNRKSTLEKSLLCCIVALVIVIIIIFICFLTSHDNEICTEPECLRAAVHILDTVDQNANPCEDFYSFACGHFIKMAMAKGHPTTLHSLKELTENQLKEIVKEDRNETDLPKSLIFQRTFYRACIDMKSIEDDDDKTFLRLLDELMGGWPLIKMNNWIDQHFTWQNAMLKARKLGLHHQLFLRVDIYENHTNDGLMLWLRPPDDNEIDSYHFNDSNEDQMYGIVKDLGADSVDILSDLRYTANFAQNLKEISKKRNNETLAYNSDDRKNITIREIHHKLIQMDWVAFLKEITGIPVKESDRIVFDIEGYLNDLYYLLLKMPKRIQANYIAWIILSTNINYLSNKLRDKYDQIVKSSNVTLPKETRSEKCYKLSMRLFRMTAEAEYIRRYTTPEMKKQIETMVAYIKSEMEVSIESAQWMDEESRRNGIKRLQNITTAIGWLDVAFNVTKIEQLTGFDKVRRLPDHQQTAIDLARIALRTKFDTSYHQIRVKMDELDRIGVPGMEVNAYFVRNYNILILPTPILQDHIFNLNRPAYMNFGALGTVIGHELSHGFTLYLNLDEVTIDEDPSNLWTNETAGKRMEIVQCVDDEFNRYQIEHGREKSNHTIGEENIADFNGVNIAYRAYQNWVRYNRREPSLPGIKFTPNQMFWIMASTYMCFEPKLSDKDKIVGRDRNHATPEFRVIGRIRHSPYFAEDFNCPEGSKMNPKEKCRLFA